MQPKSLRDKLIGTWSLVSFTERNIETGEENHPFGEQPCGLIMYTPDGYVSAQLQCPWLKRPPFTKGDLAGGTPEEHAVAGKTFIGYSGRFFIDEKGKHLEHEMQVSSFPNWQGQRQVRLVKVDDNCLTLSTDTPQLYNGALKVGVLVWQRAPQNI